MNAIATTSWTAQTAQLVRDTFARGTTEQEFQVFMATCQRLDLDPFAKQIYAVKRWDKKAKREVMSLQVSIDGFRVIAERSGQYRGQTAPQWCGDDGVWRDVWLAKEPPAAARVGVWREGFKEPLYRVARWESYVQTDRENNVTRFWATMGDVMLAKCAESLALRAAFPHVLSGLYTTDEMAQADNSEPVQAELEPTPAPAKALPAKTSPRVDELIGRIRDAMEAGDVGAFEAARAEATKIKATLNAEERRALGDQIKAANRALGGEP